MEALIERMGGQDDRIEALKELIAGQQGELVRLAEVEEEEETPLRSRGTATTAATPQEAGIPGAGQQEAAWYQEERGPPPASPSGQAGWRAGPGGHDTARGGGADYGDKEVHQRAEELPRLSLGSEVARGGRHPGAPDTGQPGRVGTEGVGSYQEGIRSVQDSGQEGGRESGREGAHQEGQLRRQGARNQAEPPRFP